MYYPYHPWKRVNVNYPPHIKFPELPDIKPDVKPPEIPKGADLEKIVTFMDKFFDEGGSLMQFVKGAIVDRIGLRKKPYFWQLDKRAEIDAQNIKCYEESIAITEIAKGMGVINTNIEGVIHPAFIYSVLIDYKKKLIELAINLHVRTLDINMDYFRKGLENYAEYIRKNIESYGRSIEKGYESVSKIYEKIALAYGEILTAHEGGSMHNLIRKRAYEISKAPDRKNNIPKENWQLAQEQILEEKIKKVIKKGNEGKVAEDEEKVEEELNKFCEEIEERVNEISQRPDRKNNTWAENFALARREIMKERLKRKDN